MGRVLQDFLELGHQGERSLAMLMIGQSPDGLNSGFLMSKGWRLAHRAKVLEHEEDVGGEGSAEAPGVGSLLFRGPPCRCLAPLLMLMSPAAGLEGKAGQAVDESSALPSGRTILAVMEDGLEGSRGGKPRAHGPGVPHEAPIGVLDAKEDPLGDAELDELNGDGI